LSKKSQQRHTFTQHRPSQCPTAAEVSARRSLIHLPSLRLLKNNAHHGDLAGAPDLMILNASEDHDDYSSNSPSNKPNCTNSVVSTLFFVLVNLFMQVARNGCRAIQRSQYAQKIWFLLLDVILYLAALFLGILSMAVLVCIQIVETSGKWIASRQFFQTILLQIFGQVRPQPDHPSSHSKSRDCHSAMGNAVSSPSGKRFFVVGRKRMPTQNPAQHTMTGTHNSTSSNSSSCRWMLKRKSS
jgi:hypothetical protein